jgi:hypothetical protein
MKIESLRDKQDMSLIDAVLTAHGGDYSVILYSNNSPCAKIVVTTHTPARIIELLYCPDLPMGSLWNIRSRQNPDRPDELTITFFVSYDLGRHYKEKKNEN